jgi:tetratricopeptide (TPR) repeat protein
MDSTTIHGADLLRSAAPFLAANDPDGLADVLRQRWPRHTLIRLLNDPDPDVVKTTVFCLGLQGHVSDTPVISRLLHNDDPVTVRLAERTLWSLWLQAGDDDTNSRLAQAIEQMNDGRFRRAIETLDTVIQRRPDFAEAFNQRAIAWYLADKPIFSIADCRRTLALNPWHFGAAAGLGHCYAQLGEYDKALDAYHAALKLHPRMEGIRQSIRQVRRMVDTRGNGRKRPD